jgi:hypothetical protein
MSNLCFTASAAGHANERPLATPRCLSIGSDLQAKIVQQSSSKE